MVTASISFNQSGAGWTIFLVTGLLAVLVLLFLGYRNQALPPGIKWTCMGIKFIAIAILLLALLEPMWTGEEAKRGSNDFLVLVDNGQGMEVQGSAELIGNLRSATDSMDSWFGKLSDTFRVESFAFDSRIRKANQFGEEVDFQGKSSDLVHAVDSLQKRYAKRPLAGMLVFSDGNATDIAALEETDLNVPVFPVLVKKDQALRDLSVTDLAVTQTAFEDAPVTLSATVKAEGYKGKKAALVLLNQKGEEVQREPLKISTSSEALPVRIRFRPVETGVSLYELKVVDAEKAADPSKETTPHNNRLSVAIDRGNGPYRVLYLTGRPNWEYKFLRRALEQDDEVDLVGLVRVAKREPKFVWRGRRGESSNPLFRGFQNNLPEEEESYDKPVLIRLNTRDAEELRDGFPKEREDLFADYHCIIIDDLEVDFFTEDQQLLIEKFVSIRGGSLLMLGGQESLQLGDYAKTPIGQMLPVYLDGSALSDGGASTASRLKLTREGWLEPWARLRLTEEDEEIRLAHMPAFQSINQLQAIKPGASPVATVVDEQQREYPALVTHRFGEGRVAVITIADVWRWGMQDVTLHDDMDKWWRQLLRWTVVDVPPFVKVTTEWDEQQGYAKRRIAVKVRDAAFRPEENATTELQIQAPGEEEPSIIFAEPSLQEPGLFTAEFVCAEPGNYLVKALVNDAAGIRLGEGEAGWSWNPHAEEFRSLLPNRAFLEEIAEKSGGRVVELDELGELVRELPEMEAPITEKWAKPLWHQPWIFSIAILMFASEWGLRRWKGLA